jgi:hypothetical protein
LVRRPRGKEGDPCIGTCDVGRDCLAPDIGAAAAIACYREDGLYCGGRNSNLDSVPFVCRKIGNIGDSCFIDGCVEGAACDDSSATGGVCVALGIFGPCVEGTCAEGAFCDSVLAGDVSTQQCRPLVENGLECQLSTQCESNYCSEEEVCATYSAATEETCNGAPPMDEL